MSQYEADSRDPGMAAERTDLAWNRSGLSLIACGAVAIRGLANTPISSGNVAVGACILTLGIVTWLLGSWRMAHARARGQRSTTSGDLLPVALGTAAIGLSALVLAVVSPA